MPFGLLPFGEAFTETAEVHLPQQRQNESPIRYISKRRDTRPKSDTRTSRVFRGAVFSKENRQSKPLEGDRAQQARRSRPPRCRHHAHIGACLSWADRSVRADRDP